MKIDILYRPGQSTAKVSLEGGEEVVAESGAMIAMNSDLQVKSTIHTKGGGGIWKAIKRMAGGENLFMNTFTAPSGGGDIYFAPTLIGDMMVYEMDGTKELLVQNQSFVASASSVEMDATWQGIKATFFSGESMIWLRLTGKGPVIFNSFGAIYEKDVDGDYVVDTGHIVAFENTLSFDVKKAGKTWFSSIAGGEGLVCRFSGKGKLYCQTHNPYGFGAALNPFLKPREQ